jgi:2-polyprenyl-3-methyl-5-hydroxy-6-metoxy-1,4-benzoquinol methylase
MEVPGHGLVTGQWDLRSGVDDYLGKVAFAGQRVLEIGPASGFLTFEMEKRGAEVVSVEVTAEHGWDFVPYRAKKLEELFVPRANHMERLKNSYWFSHAAHQSKAKVYYGDVYNLPATLGQFDIAVMGSVLLHCRDPLRIIERCGKMARSLIITDMFPSGLGRNACLPSCAGSAEFHMAYLVAIQHTVFHPIPRGDGIHDNSEFNASAASSRKSRHSFHDRRPKIGLESQVTNVKWPVDSLQ